MKKWILKILKTFGISLASIIGAVLLVAGVMYLVGALDEKVVPLEGMNFEKAAYVLDGGGDETVNPDTKVDGTIIIFPTNKDATELDVTLSIDNVNVANIVNKDGEVINTGKVGSPIELALASQQAGSESVNRGGVFTLTANQDFATAKTRVFVDTPVISANLVSVSEGFNTNEVYPGSKFIVGLQNIYPLNALNKPDTSAENEIFYSVYGENYFKKQIFYFSSNESVAKVNMLTGEVEVLSEGDFKIEAYIAKTYRENDTLPNRSEFVDDTTYLDELFKVMLGYNDGENNVPAACYKTEFSYSVQTIKIGSLTASTSVFNLDVFSKYKYTFDGAYEPNDKVMNLQLKLLPPENSGFSNVNLDYRMKDVELYDAYKTDAGYFIRKFAYDPITRIRTSQYFKITKSSLNPLMFEIEPRDYTSLEELYLVAVIDDQVYDLESDKFDNTLDAIEPKNQDAKQIPDGENFYYKPIKVNNQIIPITSINLVKSEVLVNINKSAAEGNSYILTDTDGNKFDLRSLIDANNPITPSNATYQDISFFIHSKTNMGLIDNGAGDIEPLQEINNNLITPEEDGSVYLKVKDQGVVYVYAVVMKPNTDPDADPSSANEVVFTSSIIKLVVTSKIEILSSEVKDAVDFSYEDENAESKLLSTFVVAKGVSATLTFTSSEDIVSAYSGGLFNIYTNAEFNEENEKIILTINTINATSELTITGREVGTTRLIFAINDDEIYAIEIEVVSNAIKGVNILPNDDLNITIDIEKSDSAKVLWKVGEKTADSFIIYVSNDKNVEFDNIQIICISKDENNAVIDSSVLEVLTEAPENFTPIALVDEKPEKGLALYLVPRKIYSKTITLQVSTINTDNKEFKASIDINIDKNFIENINFTGNGYNNTRPISGVNYETVVGGSIYDILKINADSKYIEYAYVNSADEDGNPIETNISHLFSYGPLELYNDRKFADVTENTFAQIPIYSQFGYSKTINVLIVPQYYVVTSSLSIDSGKTKDLATEKLVSVIKNTYDNNNKITQAEVDGNISVEYEVLSETTKGTLDATNYTAPSTFLSSTDKLKVKVSVNETISLEGILNISVNSTLSVEQITQDPNKEVYNGGTVNLNEQFQVQDKEGSKNENFTLNVEVISLPDDFGFDKTTGILTIPEDYNQVVLNLPVKVIWGENENEFVEKVLKLNVTIYELSLNNEFLHNNILYIEKEVTITDKETNEETKTNGLNALPWGNFIVASKTTKDGSVNAFDNIVVDIDDTDNNNKKAIITLTSSLDDSFQVVCDIKYEEGIYNATITLGPGSDNLTETKQVKYITSLLSYKEYKVDEEDDQKIVANTLYEALTYSVGEMVKAGIEDFDLTNVDIIEVLNAVPDTVLNETNSDHKYTLFNNTLRVRIKKDYEGKYFEFNVKFNILGRDVEVKIPFTKIKMQYTDNLTIYSNTPVTILTKNIVLQNPEDVIYEVQFDGNKPDCVNVVSGPDDIQVVVGNYLGEDLPLTINVLIHSPNYGGNTYQFEVTVKQLIITPNLTDSTANVKNILNGVKYELKDIFTIKSYTNDNDITINNTEIILNNTDIKLLLSNNEGVKITSNDGKIAFNDLSDEGSREFTLIFKVDEMQVKELKLYLICYELRVKSITTDYYEGQTLTRSELLNYIDVVESDQTINKYKELIIVNGSTDVNYEIKLTSNKQTINYKLGAKETSLTINVKEIEFRRGDNTVVSGSSYSYTIYSGSKISNYIKVGYKDNNNNFIELTNSLTFAFKGNTSLLKSSDSDTGIFEVKDYPDYANGTSFEVTASLEGLENKDFTIMFNVKTAISNSNRPLTLECDIQDINYDLKQFDLVYYKDAERINTLKTAYVIDSIEVDGSLKFDYSISNVQGNYQLEKNGVVVAAITADGVLNLKSQLDTMMLHIKAYLNEDVNGLTVENTKEEYLDFTVILTKIVVELKTEKATFNSQEYYLLDVSSKENIPLTSGKTDASSIANDKLIAYSTSKNTTEYKTFSSLKIERAFIGTEAGVVLYDTDDNSSNDIYITSDDNERENLVVVLPYYDGSNLTRHKVSIVPTGYKYDISFDNVKLASYLYLTIRYVVGGYTNTLNIRFAPEHYIQYYGDTELNNPELLSTGLIYAPATYSLNKDDSPLIRSNVEITYAKVEAQIDGLEQTKELSADTNYGYTFNYDDTEQIITFTKQDRDSKIVRAWLVVSVSNTCSYAYLVEFTSAVVETLTDSKDKITEASPLVLGNDSNIENGKIDLKQFIYINGEQYGETTPRYIKNNTYFNEVSNSTYSVSTDGLLTIKSTIIGTLNIEFNVLSSKYSLYLQGSEIKVEYQIDGLSPNVNSINLTNNKTYYIYVNKSEELNETSITCDIRESEKLDSFEVAKYLSIKNFKYISGNSTITNQDLFIYADGRVSYAGETLVELILDENKYCYILNCYASNFFFDLTITYKDDVHALHVAVDSVSINANYVNPSIRNGEQYQNVLDYNKMMNLDNFISINKESATLIYHLAESYPNFTLNGSILNIPTLTEEMYIKVKAEYGNIFTYFNIRVIPQYKITQLNYDKAFNVLLSDTINLLDYYKVEQYIKQDSANEPMYQTITNVYFKDESGSEPITDSPFSFNISTDYGTPFILYAIYGTTTQDLIFNVKTLSDSMKVDEETESGLTYKMEGTEYYLTYGAETTKLYIGETVNLLEKVASSVNKLYLSKLSSLKIVDKTGDFEYAGGQFSSNTKGTKTLTLCVNNAEIKLIVTVTDYTIECTYSSNAYEKDGVLFETLYATQVFNLTNNITFKDGTNKLLNNSELLFNVKSSNYVEYTTQQRGNQIDYLINNTLIFCIDNLNKVISVYKSINNLDLSSFNNELLITLSCQKGENTAKVGEFNIRLVAAEIKPAGLEINITEQDLLFIKGDEESQTQDAYYFNLINNVAVFEATKISYDSNSYINLNDELTFTVYAFNNNNQYAEGVTEPKYSIDDGTYLKLENLSKNTYTIGIQASVGDETNIDLFIATQVNLILTFDDGTTSTTVTDLNAIGDFEIEKIKYSTENSNENIVTSSTENEKGTVLTAVGATVVSISSENALIKKDVRNANTYFDIYVNNTLYLSINQNGEYEIKNENSTRVDLTITAVKDKFVITQTLTFFENNATFSPIELVDLSYVYESGIKYYVIYSGEKISDVNIKMASVDTKYFDLPETNLEADVVTEITARNVEAKTHVETTSGQKIYFKILPAIIEKLYTEDFKITTAQLDNKAIQQDFYYKTLYMNSSYNEYDLNDYFASTTHKDLSYGIVQSSYYKLNATDYETAYENGNIFNLSNNILSVNENFINTNLYLILRVSSQGSASILAYFRFMPIEIPTNTVNINNNTNQSLSSMFSVNAMAYDKDLMGSSNINLQSKLSYKLAGHTESYIEDSVLYVREVFSGETTKINIGIYLDNVKIKEALIEINNPSINGYYANNIDYKEVDYEESNTTDNTPYSVLTYTLNAGLFLKEITVDGVSYNTVISGQDDENDANTQYTQIYVGDNYIKLYETNLVETNILSVIFVSVEDSSGVLSYYKLNNYKFVQKSNYEHTYYENGVISNKQICYEIVGENGLVYDNVKVTVEEMSIIGEDFTINRTTGEATGELPTDASNARIRVYVKDVLYDNGSNYIIVSQTKH